MTIIIITMLLQSQQTHLQAPEASTGVPHTYTLPWDSYEVRTTHTLVNMSVLDEIDP